MKVIDSGKPKTRIDEVEFGKVFKTDDGGVYICIEDVNGDENCAVNVHTGTIEWFECDTRVSVYPNAFLTLE